MTATKFVAIISLFATVLAGAAEAEAEAGTTANTTAATKAIQDLCQSTRYQQTCIDSLSSATNSSDAKTLIAVSFQLIIKEVENVLEQIPALQNTAEDPYIAGPMGTYAVCQHMLQRSIEDLQKAVDRVNSVDATGDLTVATDDIATYLSGANTDHETCMDAFEDLPDRAEQMRQLLNVARELTYNGVVWANEFPGLIKSSSP